MKRIRTLVRENERAPDGRRSFSFGARVGYWPCVRGPFVQLTFGFRRVSVWWGLESVL